MPGADEVAHGVGQVELALRVDGLQPVERGPEQLGPEDVDRGVRLADRELLGRRVGRLDDRLEVAVGAADDPAVAADVGGDEREHGRAGGPATGASRSAPRAARSSGAACRRRGSAPRRRRRAPPAALRTASPVPSGCSCTATVSPSNWSAVSGEATTTSGSAPSGRAASTIQSTIRRPRIGCRCLGVAERMRVPRPPAMTTAASLGRDSDTVGTLAGAPGFEPGITGPKPVALPLGHAPVNRDAECTRTPGHPCRSGRDGRTASRDGHRSRPVSRRRRAT